MENKNVNKITKEKLIRMISKDTGMDIDDTRLFYNTFEQMIFDLMLETDKDNTVSLRMFDGIKLDCTFVPSSIKVNNLTGKENIVKSKLKPKFHITRSYCDKLNSDDV